MIGSSPSNNYTRQTSVGGRCVLLAGIFSVQSCATQVLAALLKNPSQIGWGVYGLYFPFAWISWVLKNPGHGAIPTVLGVAILGTAVVFIVYMLWLKGEQKGAGNPNLHGTASFAKEEHIRQMGLMLEGGSPGVYIGAWQDKRGRTRYLQHGGAEHIILYAPTRSGKGISTVLPTLLSWQQSVLVWGAPRLVDT
jgi:type IV secretion system protein VirD4